MRVSQQITKRFLAAILRLKGELTEKIVKDIVLDYILKDLSDSGVSAVLTSTDFRPEHFKLSFRDEGFTVQASIILALMEASDNLKEFEKLHKKQQERAAIPTKKPDKKLSDFDKILEGIMKVPKQDKQTGGR